MIKKILVLMLCISCTACASSWILVTQSNKNFHVGQLSVQAPIGWVLNGGDTNKYIAMVKGERVQYSVDRIMLTKDGDDLDSIEVTRFDLADSFPGIEQFADGEMLPAELAEKYLAEIQITLGIEDLQLVKNEPALIANKKGFVVQFRHHNKRGLQYDHLVFGFATTAGFYTLSYQAPSLHYFPVNLADFDTMLKTLELI